MKGKNIKLTLVTISGMVLKVVLSQDPDKICSISDRGFLIVLDPLKISLNESLWMNLNCKGCAFLGGAFLIRLDP